MKSIYILTICLLITINILAQDCSVTHERIKGTYTGDCIKGKAEGMGKSVGLDSYEGQFKNGYPDGVGTYTWDNKNFYKGNFKKGVKEGPGEMHYVVSNKTDSIIKGFWKKDNYIGEFEKTHFVVANTTRITRIDARLSRKGGTDIHITATQIGDGVPTITSVVPVKGLFINQYSQKLSNSSTFRLQQVEFPFRAIFYFSNGENMEIQFNEKAEYDVSVGLM